MSLLSDLNAYLDLLLARREALVASRERGASYPELARAAQAMLSPLYEQVKVALKARDKAMDEADYDLKDPEQKAAARALHASFTDRIEAAHAAVAAREAKADYIEAHAAAEAVRQDYFDRDKNKTTIHHLDNTISILLAAAGRMDEVSPDKFGVEEFSNVVVGGLSRDHLTYLGPDTQIWFTPEGRDGNKYLSLKPAPGGDNWILILVNTRYFDIQVFIGPKDKLLDCMSRHTFYTLRLTRDENWHNIPRMHVLVPIGGVGKEGYDICTVHQRMDSYLRGYGAVSDGFIRLSPLTATLMIDPDIYGPSTGPGAWYLREPSEVTPREDIFQVLVDATVAYGIPTRGEAA